MDLAQECGLVTPHDIPQGTIRAMAEYTSKSATSTR